jgi:hypothetical protein
MLRSKKKCGEKKEIMKKTNKGGREGINAVKKRGRGVKN